MGSVIHFEIWSDGNVSDEVAVAIGSDVAKTVARSTVGPEPTVLAAVTTEEVRQADIAEVETYFFDLETTIRERIAED